MEKKIEVDYRGYEVTVENFIRVLVGRHPEDVSRSKRLLTDERSNILIYVTGHGGNEFLKFQDAEEISSHDIADAFAQMWEKKRYHQILFMADTCQAASLHKHFYSPNILAIGSSKVGQNSYSHHSDDELGVAVIDRFTYYTLEYFENIDARTRSVGQLFNSYDPRKLNSHHEARIDLFPRKINTVPLTDFFGSVMRAEITPLLSSGQSDDVCTAPPANKPRVDIPKPETIETLPLKNTNTTQVQQPALVNSTFIILSGVFAVLLFVMSSLFK